MNKLKLLITFLFLALISNSVFAADDPHQAPAKHVVGAFLGITSADEHTYGTFGGEYEYRIDRMFGVGVLVEHTPKAHHGDGTTIFMGQLHLHPWKELRLTGGYGREKIHHEGSHSEDVLRLGVAYDFHMNGFGIAPTFNVDWINGHTSKVFGFVINKGF